MLNVRHRVEIETHLAKVLSSPALGGASTNWSRLLRFIVQTSLNDQPELLYERSIGEHALGRRPGYDAQRDRIVSVTKNRLINEKLPAYYAAEGRHDRVRFHMPAKGYLVDIEIVPEQVPIEMLIEYHGALRAYDGRTVEGMMMAMGRLERLVEIAPTHGPSWALLAEISLVAANLFADPRIFMPKCRLAAVRALAIDERLWRAPLVSGNRFSSCC